MSLKKTLIFAVITTCLSISYVNQQISVVKLSYQLRSKEKNLSELIDQNRILLYNNASLKSPQYLAGMLKENDQELTFPDTTVVAKVKMVRKDHRQQVKTTKSNWRTKLLDLFIPKAQAALDKRQ
ncbi:MAG: hypothetical protein ABIG64_08815 [Candidatus Omnitrophota bacterium]